ncbi:MAG: ABC transporter ATP-binding protein [Devosia sp.]
MSALVITDLSVAAGPVPILSGVSLTAPVGAVTGLIGPNGAGKSTLIAATAGLLPGTGAIRFADTNLLAIRPADRARLVAHVEQSATTTERLTVRDAVALGRIPYQSTWQSAPSADDERIVDDAITALGLAPFAARLYHTLSGGEQQRVQLARALAQNPTLLLLDEPTSHLDIQAQLTVLELLRHRAATGITVLIALHDLNLAARFCDHLVVLHHGRVVAEGPPHAVLTPELLLTVYGVHASIVSLPGATHPLVVYDRAALGDFPPKPD